MKIVMLTLLALSFVAVAPAVEAHIGTEGGCSWYDIDIDPSHWHVCAGTVQEILATENALA